MFKAIVFLRFACIIFSVQTVVGIVPFFAKNIIVCLEREISVILCRKRTFKVERQIDDFTVHKTECDGNSFHIAKKCGIHRFGNGIARGIVVTARSHGEIFLLRPHFRIDVITDIIRTCCSRRIRCPLGKLYGSTVDAYSNDLNAISFKTSLRIFQRDGEAHQSVCLSGLRSCKIQIECIGTHFVDGQYIADYTFRIVRIPFPVINNIRIFIDILDVYIERIFTSFRFINGKLYFYTTECLTVSFVVHNLDIRIIPAGYGDVVDRVFRTELFAGDRDGRSSFRIAVPGARIVLHFVYICGEDIRTDTVVAGGRFVAGVAFGELRLVILIFALTVIEAQSGHADRVKNKRRLPVIDIDCSKLERARITRGVLVEEVKRHGIVPGSCNVCQIGIHVFQHRTRRHCRIRYIRPFTVRIIIGIVRIHEVCQVCGLIGRNKGKFDRN